MCGIAGILVREGNRPDQATLRRMTRAVAHRGPDGEGIWSDGPVGFGHRRLAIMDLTDAARQPMLTDDGRYALTYGGEVYNFRELRTELEALGHRFRSTGDAEVVLHAFAEWGDEAIPKFNGMFAFAIWDAQRRILTIARDRFGIKPLYYASVAETTFLFGSEIKSLITHPNLSARLSPRHLVEYFRFQNVFSDGTLFEGVTLLHPGTIMEVDAASGRTTQRRYWSFTFEPGKVAPSLEEAVEELDARFRRAVHRQTRADVEVGGYLSGGLDSAGITAVATQHCTPFWTFTAGFDLSSASGIEMACDEREKAEALSYRYGTCHYEVVLKAGDIARSLPELTWHLEDLRVGQSYPNFYVSDLARRFVKVVLTGVGGDELFGGYPWRYLKEPAADADAFISTFWQSWHRLGTVEEIDGLFRPELGAASIDAREVVREALRDVATPGTQSEAINAALTFEARTFLRGLFIVEDKLSMAHGLEARVPFMDNELVDFARTLPAHLKIDSQSARHQPVGRDGKLVLRELLRRYVPKSVADHPKQGFSAPDASWFRGDSIDYVRGIIWDPQALMYNFLDPETVQRLVGDHLAGRTNRRLLIWSLLSFEWWCRLFLDGQTPVSTWKRFGRPMNTLDRHGEAPPEWS